MKYACYDSAVVNEIADGRLSTLTMFATMQVQPYELITLCGLVEDGRLDSTCESLVVRVLSVREPDPEDEAHLMGTVIVTVEPWRCAIFWCHDPVAPNTPVNAAVLRCYFHVQEKQLEQEIAQRIAALGRGRKSSKKSA